MEHVRLLTVRVALAALCAVAGLGPAALLVAGVAARRWFAWSVGATVVILRVGGAEFARAFAIPSWYWDRGEAREICDVEVVECGHSLCFPAGLRRKVEVVVEYRRR